MSNLIARLLAVVLSIALALVLLEATLRAVPALIPLPVFYQLPGGGRYLQPLEFDQPVELGFHYRPHQSQAFTFDPDDPSLLGDQAGAIAARDQPRKLRLQLVTDEYGFLNHPPTQPFYPVVVTGDSFLGLSADEHWLEWLPPYLGSRPLNLGIPGWGPQAEVAALRIYGKPRQPREMVLAFFEGNDLWDAQQYEMHRASGLSWVGYDLRDVGFYDRLVLPVLARRGIAQFERWWEPKPAEAYRYPIQAQVAGRELGLVFADQYVGRLTAPRADIEASVNLKLTAEALRRGRDVAREIGARFTVVYIPSEERVYLPLLRDNPGLDRAIDGVFTSAVGPDGALGPTATPVDLETLFANLDAQAQVMEALVRGEGIGWLDLTPAFREAASRGETLYNYADTHWNGEGHKLAASVLGPYLQPQP